MNFLSTRFLKSYRRQPILVRRKAEFSLLVTGLVAGLFLTNVVFRLLTGVLGPTWYGVALVMITLVGLGLWWLHRGQLEAHVNLLAFLCTAQCVAFFDDEVSRQFFVLSLFSMVTFAILALKPYQKGIAFLVFPLLVAAKGGWEFWLAAHGKLSRSTVNETIFTLVVFAASIPLVSVLMTIMGREIHHAELLLGVNKHLRTEVGTDRLTGTWNRRAFDRLVRRETGEALRTSRPLSLAVLDLDRFKAVNDHWGHQAGDQALIRAVSVLGGVLRQGDSLIRWGGDEFVLLLPGSGPEEAALLGDKLREAVGMDPDLRAWNLGVSLGIAVWRPGEDVADLLARADSLLYQAKQGGRNRVCSDPDR